MLTFALPKGRMFFETMDCLAAAGWEIPEFDPDERKLIFYDCDQDFKFVLVKPYDVPTYVEYGTADIGVSGKDVIEEREANVYELLDLKFSGCRLSVAGPRDNGISRKSGTLRVATEFTRLAENYFSSRGENVEIIKLHGSVELAPLLGLADQIVDIVSSGKTLKQNNLEEKQTILQSSARLIVNRPALKLHQTEIKKTLERLKGVLN